MNTVLSVIFGASEPEEFRNTYHCYSFAMHDSSDAVRSALRQGGKLLLPNSALRVLTAGPDTPTGGDPPGPMIFSLTAGSRRAIAGVQEFTAPEGAVLAPDWVMRRLALSDGDIVRVAAEPGRLPAGQFARLRPHGSFLADVSDPKAALERLLRGFSCLSVGDEIELEHAGRRYQLDVVELRPRPQVCIVDCDLSVEFLEETTRKSEPAPAARAPAPAAVAAIAEFPGVGIRLDKAAPEPAPAAAGHEPRTKSRAPGQPNLAYAWGSLSYPQHRRVTSPGDPGPEAPGEAPRFAAFSGAGRTLGGGRRNGHCCELPEAPGGIDIDCY